MPSEDSDQPAYPRSLISPRRALWVAITVKRSCEKHYITSYIWYNESVSCKRRENKSSKTLVALSVVWRSL